MKILKKYNPIILFLLGLILALVSVKFESNPKVYKALTWSGFIFGIIGGFKLMGLSYKK
ncbi:hypothetical protein RBU49_06195 [Clostridium sp. MB40-C1]|uniref:hypothetical protein n=1 Tax=Clostridium sp. MB40-C1 TaxID=3070996 RepID=UPI0027E20416|nr:hypothetical protein [Clostridium sp. MB40-C1]WMJ81834.1 hypothetical protein RBU49_06195 [Clostridium sp. MB40-C1]